MKKNLGDVIARCTDSGSYTEEVTWGQIEKHFSLPTIGVM